MNQLTRILSLGILLGIPLFSIASPVQQTIGDTTFVNLCAQDYPIAAEGLPYFHHSYALGYTDNTLRYAVSLDYPEYRELTSSETKALQPLADEIGEQIQVTAAVGFSRKKGYLDVSFCPIIRKGKKYFRLVSCKVNILPQPLPTSTTLATTKAAASPASRWKKRSVLAEGKWGKIRVKNEGVYAITPALIQKMGFSDMSKIKVYGYGGRIQKENWTFDTDEQVPDDLNEIPLYRKSDGTALFFAEGTVRWNFHSKKNKWIHENNPYSNYSYYFITEGEQPATLQQVKCEAAGATPVRTIPYYQVIDNDVFGWYEGGREMYDKDDYSQTPSHSYKMKAVSLDETQPSGIVDVSFSAASSTSTTKVNVNLNDKTLGNYTISSFGRYQSAMEGRRSYNSDKLTKENSVKLSITPSNPGRLNFIRLNYKRELNAADPAFSFTPMTSQQAVLEIKGATDQTRLWRIGTWNQPACEIAGTLNNGVLSAPIENGKDRYVIVNLDQSFPAPEWVGKVENQNLHGDSTAYDMVILIPASRKLAEEAERMAEAHRDLQQLRVKVVDAGQLFNEFSSGTPDASAYRRYMKMLYDRADNDKDMPRYLLLFGDCSWDNRMVSENWKMYKPEDYLLSFEVTNNFNEETNTIFPLGEQDSYVTDDFYGWLDDNEGNDYRFNKIDLGIGRFPCSDAETAKILVDKSISYLKNEHTGSWKNEIYVIADNGNANLHMEDAEVVVQQINESTQDLSIVKKVYNDAYTRFSTGVGHTFPTVTEILRGAIKRGALIFNYTGHGNPGQLSNNTILKTEDFETPTLGNMPLWIMASCEISPFDSRKYDLGRAAVRNPNGGAIAVICAARSVLSNYNRILNVALNQHLFSNDAQGKPNTMGDALRLTKVDMVTPNKYGQLKDASINKLKYILLGNPAVHLTYPRGKVVLDSINGVRLGSGNVQLKAGSLARFSGHVANNKGVALPDFNGSISAVVMDRLETITCKNNDGTADSPMVYQDRTKKIFEGRDSVRNGKFSVTMRVPKDISYTNDCGRINFYAINHDNSLECNGKNDQFFLNGTDNSYAADTLAPKLSLYLNHPDFPNGGITGPNPIFYADIEDDRGINATGMGIGHNMELVIDGDMSNPINLNDNFQYIFGSYREGGVTYPFQNLAFGKHELAFRVWDVNGNSTTKTLQFNVQDGIHDGFDLYASRNPARTSTNLMTRFEADPEKGYTATFKVFDLYGRMIWQSQPIQTPAGSSYGMATWNLTNSSGARVPAGIYLYQVTVQNESEKKESDAKKIIVLEQ